MQIIGLCRFSYPALGGFQVIHDTVEERRAYLYQADRLQERFRLFEASTLPCFREQTDEDFELLILIGDCLPKDAFDRLHDLTADIPQIRIVAQPADTSRPHRQIMKSILNAARKDPDQPCVQFRHDDDDAVSVDFVERLRLAVSDAEGLMARQQMVGIDFNCGYLASFGPGGIEAAEVCKPLLGVGLGMHVAGGCKQTIMNFTHNRLGRFMPVLSYPDAPMWVRTLNQFNDSPRAQKARRSLSPVSPELQGEFQARFAIDAKLVRKIHSAT